MADQKVSDLPALNGADVDAADLLYIVDSSAGSAGSKKITVGQYQLAPVSGGTANGVLYLDGSKVVTTGSALVFDGTNLGIGTSSPAGKVDAVSNAYAAFTARSSTSGAGQTVDALKAVDSVAANFANAKYSATAHIWNYAGSTEGMRLDASGNLGIGTNSPGARLETVASGSAIYFSGGDSAGARRLQFNATTTTNTGDTQNINALGSTGVLAFSTNSSERARITSGGNLLVGTTNDIASDAKLVAKNSTAATVTAGFWNAATSGDNLFAGFYTEATITVRGSISYNRAGGLVAYNTTSDYRAKDIIGPVQDPGATIDALKVYEGKMKGATQSRPMLVAHEAQAVAPYCVTGEKDAVNEDGTPKFQQMDVSSLVPLLLAEIQSLRARVAALESA